MKRVVIVGATSAIAEHVARLFARDRSELFLAARNEERLASMASDLTVRGATRVSTMALDMNDIERHAAMWSAARDALGSVDALLVAYGSLPDQRASEGSVEITLREFSTNATSVIALLTRVAGDFAAAGSGCIAVITSVAGDRGRASNYVYGAAKGAVSIFLSGLRNRLAGRGVAVLTIKPGFVDTPMTAHLPKNRLYAQPEQVARAIYRAMRSGRDVAYVPGFWRWIMMVIRAIPERRFKRMSL
jgi:decaprenylphospho-beta-D-erythro-pentofuranosid-2-ulose 2-reductase